MPGSEPPPGSLWGDRRRARFEETLSGRAAEVLAVVQEVATRNSATVAQIALKWVIAHPEITVAISGADTEQQLQQNLGALDVDLSPHDLQLLDAVSAGLGMVLDGAQYGPPVAPRQAVG